MGGVQLLLGARLAFARGFQPGLRFGLGKLGERGDQLVFRLARDARDAFFLCQILQFFAGERLPFFC